MASTDDQAPATKQDIALLTETMGKLLLRFEGIDEKIEDLDQKLNAKIESLNQKLNEKIDLNQRVLLMKLERDRQDVFDVYDHKLAGHDRRIIALEEHAGLQAA